MIEQPVEGAADEFGETTDTWTRLDDDRVEIVPRSSREFTLAASMAPEITHLVRMRYRSDVTSEMRLNLGNSRYLYISDVPLNVLERNEELIFACKEHST